MFLQGEGRVRVWSKVWLRVAVYPLYCFNLLVEVQEAGFGVQLNSGKCVGELLFQMTLWALATRVKLTEAY